MTDSKHGKRRPIQLSPLRLVDAIGTVKFDALVPSSISSMTDEEWDAHDAKVAAAKARDASADVAGIAKAKRDRLVAAGFPSRALEFARAAKESEPMIRRVASWDVDATNVLVISGSKGCGKTVAATWWAMQQPSTPVFVRASTFAASSRYDRDERAAWFAAPAMVLDDLGAEFLDAKGSFLVDLDELIDVYYGDRKPLLITTNCTKKIFDARYDARIVDRLRECATWFGSTAESRRTPST